SATQTHPRSSTAMPCGARRSKATTSGATCPPAVREASIKTRVTKRVCGTLKYRIMTCSLRVDVEACRFGRTNPGVYRTCGCLARKGQAHLKLRDRPRLSTSE